MTDLTDESLLKTLCNGEIKSLGILYERYKGILHNYFFRVTGDQEASNDLLMATFERIYKYRQSYESRKKVRPWIFQIASNLIKDHYKKSKRWVSINTSHYKEKTMNTEVSMDRVARHKKLHKALHQLKPSQRNIISMYYLLEMSYQDISISENISVNNARIKICRSLKKLKEILKDSDL